ncbi:MAG: hypothetical protein JW995_09275 [Melioribacteraceae bacterium]|nr:hypothetical protein [Melioribacteraceae bacterium]
MKKLIYIVSVIVLLLAACDDFSDKVVDPATNYISIEELVVPAKLEYSDQNPELVVKIRFEDDSEIDEVWFDVEILNGTFIKGNNIQMKDNGSSAYGDESAEDNIYSGKVTMSDQDPTGVYVVRFSIRTIENVAKDVGFGNFLFDKGKPNVAPVLSDLIMPDSVTIGEEFTFTVEASDSNGLSDIELVYFDFYRPNGEFRGRVPMDDTGNADLGDSAAGDGIFSFRNSFNDSETDTVMIGAYRFEFEARDRAGRLSNKITHNIVVQK